MQLYHPVRIAQYGLHSHARFYETGDVARAPRHSWPRLTGLVANARTRDGIDGCYVYEFPNPRYGVGSGWLSAMAQGEAISLLLRAAAVEGSAAYLHAAVRAAQPFRHSIENGGVVYRSARDCSWKRSPRCRRATS